MDEKHSEFPNARDDEALEVRESNEHYNGRYGLRHFSTAQYVGIPTVEETIELSRAAAMLKQTNPDDNMNALSPYLTYVGKASLLAWLNWDAEKNNRAVAAERAVFSVRQGDILEARLCPVEVMEHGYAFYTTYFTLVPYTPFRDVDDDFFTDEFNAMKPYERLVCIVDSIICSGSDGVDRDPLYRVRMSDCRVTVYRLSTQVA